MGQEVSVTCPVCKIKESVYKDVFKAECLNVETYCKYQRNYPPFDNFLGKNSVKYMYQSYPLQWNKAEGYVYWMFYSCDECILIDDITRNEKFSEYNPSGVKIWRSQLP